MAVDFLRHSSRQIHHTVANHIQDGLTALSWTDPTNTPLGAPAVRFQRQPAFVGSKVSTAVSAGLVAITLGPEMDPVTQELGPLTLVALPVFIDVFMDKQSHAQALAEDIRDLLLGRFPDLGGRFIPVVDQATRSPATGWKIEFTDHELRNPDVITGLAWRAVKVTASTYFQEVSP